MTSSTKSILAIDQGTTSSRAILFSQDGNLLAQQNQEFEQIFPQDGWVEHRPEDIWQSTLDMAAPMMTRATRLACRLLGLGSQISERQVVIWDRQTGQAIHNAIVWQDRRTASICEALQADGHLKRRDICLWVIA